MRINLKRYLFRIRIASNRVAAYEYGFGLSSVTNVAVEGKIVILSPPEIASTSQLLIINIRKLVGNQQIVTFSIWISLISSCI